ncbi:MAG: helix-turn-helix domain-containing protein [bacterium]|nr:helix-turn-helix domain-containing protein [bacterium]
MTRPSDLGLVLQQLRRRRGLAQAELAERADVGRKWLSQVENGKQTAEIGLVMRVLYVLGYGIELVEVAPPADIRGMVDAFDECGDDAT